VTICNKFFSSKGQCISGLSLFVGFVLADNMDNATFVCKVLEISNDNDRGLQPSLQIPKQLNSLSRQRNSITLNYVNCNLCEEGLGKENWKWVLSTKYWNCVSIQLYSN